MTRAELMSRMSSLEFAYWIAYYGLEPFGSARDDMHAAAIQHTLMLCNWASKTEKPPPLTSFLIVPPARPQMSGDMLLAMARQASAALAPLKAIE